MPLTDLNLKPVYNHSNCPDMIAGLYEPLLREAVRYNRTTYTFTAKGLIAAAAGTAGLVRNSGRIRLICDHTVRSDILQAIQDGQIQAETALLQTHNIEDLMLVEADDISKDHLELATWLVANGVLEIKVAIRDPSIFHAKSGIVEDTKGTAPLSREASTKPSQGGPLTGNPSTYSPAGTIRNTWNPQSRNSKYSGATRQPAYTSLAYRTTTGTTS